MAALSRSSSTSPFTIYLCHHSHTDIGYTHDQPVVMELHSRFIDQALTLADRFQDRGDATFRWTCEVTATLDHWLRSASTRDIDRLVAAVHRGQFEVCALKYNLTPLASHARLVEMLKPAMRFRKDLDIPIRVAMNSDVNGQSWGLTDVLLDHGIDALTMSINEHFGHAPEPRPGALDWKAPSGRSVLVWNGHTYAHTAWLCIGQDMPIARDNIQRLIAALHEDGYRLPFLYMQITHPGPQNDNMGAVPWLSDWIARFNEQGNQDRTRLVLTTPGKFFDVLRAHQSLRPTVVTGDWTDWWNFGAASTPTETAINRASQWRLADADLLAAFQPQAFNSRLRRRAEEAIDLWNEHTWGADCSVHLPDDPDTAAQWHHKAYPAYEARALTGLLLRDGMTALSHHIRHEDRPGIVIFNPTAYSITTSLNVSSRFLNADRVPLAPLDHGTPSGWPHDPSYQTLVDRSAWQDHQLVEIGPFQLPPFGWSVASAADAADDAPLQTDATSIIARRFELSTSEGAAGLSRFVAGGREWAAANGPLPFGAVIAEEIKGVRGDIMRFDDGDIPARSRRPVWNEDVPLQRHLPRDVLSSVHQNKRSATITQTSSLPTCRSIVQQWSVLPDSDMVELRVQIQKSSITDPHALYLALPFQCDSPRVLAEVAGAVAEPDRQQVPGSAPWMSMQGGFCMGNPRGTVYVATPDTPLTQFRRFRIGSSKIAGQSVDHPALALLWLYNNYWETNFVADADGIFRFRVLFGFSDGSPDPARLVRFCEQAARPPVFHPLPVRGMSGVRGSDVEPTLPREGQVIGVESNTLSFVPLSSGEGGELRVLIHNPSDETATAILFDGAAVISSAEVEMNASAVGTAPGELHRVADQFIASVEPRRSLCVRLKLTFPARV